MQHSTHIEKLQLYPAPAVPGHEPAITTSERIGTPGTDSLLSLQLPARARTGHDERVQRTRPQSY